MCFYILRSKKDNDKSVIVSSFSLDCVHSTQTLELMSAMYAHTLQASAYNVSNVSCLLGRIPAISTR